MKNESSESSIRVLIIDDDRKLCALLQEYLKPFGYDVTSVFTGADGLKKALAGDFHVIILDVMLPGMDGFDVLKAIRRSSDLPVLMLTSRGDETDRIVGLEIGADDYLPKTFSTRELLARLRAVTRRAYSGPDKNNTADELPIIVGDIRVDAVCRTAWLSGEELLLTPLEFDLLYILASSPNRVLSRNQLLDKVGKREYEVYDRSIDVHISSLRRKLGDDSRKSKYIKTVRSIGYMLLSEGRGET